MKVFFRLFIIFAFFGALSAHATSPTPAGAVVSVKDVVTILSSSGKRSAQPGDSIYESDTISTSPNGAVKIFLKDHSIVDIGAGTVLKLEKYLAKSGTDREVELNLEKGVVRGAVSEKISGTGKFHLKTSGATMGVRGTEFVVEAGDAGTFTVLQGQIEVAGSGAFPQTTGVIVNAGQQIVAKQNTPFPTTPQSLDPSALRRVSSLARVQDNTFSKSVVLDTSSKKRSPASTGSSENPSLKSTFSEMTKAISSGSAGSSISLTDLGIAGTFSALSALRPVATTNNNYSRITIKVH